MRSRLGMKNRARACVVLPLQLCMLSGVSKVRLAIAAVRAARPLGTKNLSTLTGWQRLAIHSWRCSHLATASHLVGEPGCYDLALACATHALHLGP